jgi:hypothetical protein
MRLERVRVGSALQVALEHYGRSKLLLVKERLNTLNNKQDAEACVGQVLNLELAREYNARYSEQVRYGNRVPVTEGWIRFDDDADRYRFVMDWASPS